jgi:uncharacterized repeat protein (TIGR03803 family)
MNKLFRLLILPALLSVFALGQAQENVLWSFGGYSNQDGGEPVGKLVFDNAGNLYGTTTRGGLNGYGSVFELSPNIDGSWKESSLYNFCSQSSDYQCLDGAYPEAGLVIDSAGNLYGTSSQGGGICPRGTLGCGEVFELSPPAQLGDAWTYSALYKFCSVQQNGTCLDGAVPYSKLTFDAEGNLYGTATNGGSTYNAGGVVFELSPSQGAWTESVLYNFCSVGKGEHCLDGYDPIAGVSFDKSGNIYGTTFYGGSSKYSGSGVVYKLLRGANGWTETVLATFLNGPLGGNPMGEVNFDAAGNLYSTTSFGGDYHSYGTVFRIDPSTNKILALSFNNTDGGTPLAGVSIDEKTGAIYGTASTGGEYGGGVLYKISGRTETVIYNFGGLAEPDGALITDRAGNFYGVTKQGGNDQEGTVYEIIP